MWQYVAKVGISAVLIVFISEIAKRNSFWAAVLASLPITSILAFIWLFADTGDAVKVANLSNGIFWLVLPSLALFLVLPLLIRIGWGFWPSLATASAATVMAYMFMLWLLPKFGVQV